MNIQLMTDGGADIPNRISEMVDVKIVPLYIHFKDDHYNSSELALPTFFHIIKENNELPRSSAPSPHEFYEAYTQIDNYKTIIMLSISQELSSTYENAIIGKNMLLEEEPARKLEVINTNTASCGVAHLLYDSHVQTKENMKF